MRKLMSFCYTRPFLILAIVAVISAGAAAGLPNLRIDTSTEGLIAKGGPENDFYNQTVKMYGPDNIALIFVKDPKLFTPAKLAVLEKLVSTLEDLKGVDKIESLFSVSNNKNIDGSLSSGPLMDWVPETQEEADAVKKDALANSVFNGNLVSAAGDATGINIYLESHPEIPSFTANFAERVEEIIAPYKSQFATIFQTGFPFNTMTQRDTINQEQLTLVPLSMGILFLLLVVSMRTPSAALLPMTTAGLSVLWTMGFMAWTGMPMTVLSSIVPSLLIIIGSTEDIHILSKYLEGIEHNDGKHQDKVSLRHAAVDFMAAKVGTAVVLTGLTTFVGFLSIAVNDITMMRQFGLIAAFGLFVNPLVTGMLAPIYLRYMGPLKKKETTGEKAKQVLKVIGDFIIGAIRRYKWSILAALLILSIASGIAGWHVEMDNNPQKFFKPDSPLVRQVNTLRENLAGAYIFYLRVDADHKGAFRDPKNLAKLEKLVKYLEGTGKFDKVISINNFIKQLHREMNEGNQAFYKLPTKAESISEYLLFLHRKDVEKYVMPDYESVNILVRHNLASSKEVNQVVAQVDAEARKIFPPPFKSGITGTNVLVNQAVTYIAIGQVQGIGLITLVIMVLMTILFVNIKAGLLSLIPNLFPVSLMFGFMWLMDIPLNVGTSMVGAIAIGIAVDDTVHFMAHYQKEMRELQDQQASAEATIRAELLPVLTTSVALGLGFGILGISDFVPIQRFGLLSGMVMIYALLADMFLTPILLTSTQLITLWDMLGLKLRQEVLEGSQIFANLARWQVKKLVLLGQVHERTPGEDVLQIGQRGHGMFVVLEGEARAYLPDPETGKELPVARFRPGHTFGETGLVDHEEPSQTLVRAETELSFIEISWSGLERLRKLYPRIAGKLFLNVSRILGGRLVESDKMLADTKRALSLRVDQRRSEMRTRSE